MNLRRMQLMERLREAATAPAPSGDNCQRCRLLNGQIAALNRRVAALQFQAAAQPQQAPAAMQSRAAVQPRRAPKRRRPAADEEDVEPSTDGSVRIVGEERL